MNTNAGAWPPKPQDSPWTDEQWEAISVRGSNTLVAAAAGSGKTAVLVERIIRRVTDPSDPVQVDELLVATFTKAAAAEMRGRIRAALEKELEQHPDSAHIRRQLSLIGRAQITTLHSFCLEVIQTYYEQIALDPAFRVADDTEAELLRRDVLEQLLEEAYSASDENRGFWQLVDSFGEDRSDEPVYRLIESVYDFSRSHPWPEAWLEMMCAVFEDAEADNLDRLGWVSGIAHEVRLALQGAADALERAARLASAPDGPASYLETIQAEAVQVERLLAAAETNAWDEMAEAFRGAVFGKLKPSRGESADKAVQEKAKALREQAKKTVTELKNRFFSRSAAEHAAELREMAPAMRALVSLVREFGRRYTDAKRQKGLLDFSDLEHYCLAILRAPESTPECAVPSAAALDYRKRFAEILLDEYQDTNPVQEAIVELISRTDSGNRFMVGDVKQSIYRFRLAEPGLFLAKYRQYGRTGADSGWRIDLARNFRSRREVVDAVNFVFKQAMSETVAEIEYDEQAELKLGASYPDAEGPGETPYAAELILVHRPEGQDGDAMSGEEHSGVGPERGDAAEEGGEPDPETAQLEARAIARRIRELSGDGGEPLLVYDKAARQMRPVTYRDIVILLRAAHQWAPVMLEELRREGIPAYAELNAGYFEAVEVETVLSLLKLIDNPYQDIPLAAVLRSPICGLAAEELAQVRLQSKGTTFYEAVVRIAEAERWSTAAEQWSPLSESSAGSMVLAGEPAEAAAALADTAYETGSHDGTTFSDEALAQLRDKLRTFLVQLQRWREDARELPLPQLIWSIYQQTGYYDFVGGLPGGLQRQANLRALYDRARQYENTTFRGLFRFLRFVERLRERGGDLGAAGAIGEQENVVRIMTIHKSKGLEFPVVFVAGLGKSFNRQDLHGSFLLHRELGFGPRFVDTQLRISYPTLPLLAIRSRLEAELLAEEMRVLYVALTRAKEKLILVGTVKRLDKTLQKWESALDQTERTLPDGLLAAAECYLDWIGASLMRHPDADPLRQANGLAGRPSLCLEDSSRWIIRLVSSAQSESEAKEMAEAADDSERQITSVLEPQASAGGLADEADPVDRRLSWKYPFRRASQLFAKTSVTEMKRRAMAGWELEEPESAEHPALAAPLPTLHLKRPRFLEGKRRLSAAERGTLYHTVMQHLPLKGEMNRQYVAEMIAELVSKRIISPEAAEELDPEPIAAFLAGPLGRRLNRSALIRRELPFSYGMPAEEVYPDEEESVRGEIVLVQGVIDCIFLEEDGWVLLDYKTDAVSVHGLERTASRYELQLRLYAKAIERIWRQPVKEAFLYFFDGGRVVKVPLTDNQGEAGR